AVTYDHRLKKIGHPVRSAKLKLQIGGLVVGWVTTSEYPLLYVYFWFFLGWWRRKVAALETFSGEGDETWRPATGLTFVSLYIILKQRRAFVRENQLSYDKADT
ncbi:hypothetical protein DL98DRAFT_410753, partial [Cadophora sp. DSE1049]